MREENTDDLNHTGYNHLYLVCDFKASLLNRFFCDLFSACVPFLSWKLTHQPELFSSLSAVCCRFNDNQNSVHLFAWHLSAQSFYDSAQGGDDWLALNEPSQKIFLIEFSHDVYNGGGDCDYTECDYISGIHKLTLSF